MSNYLLINEFTYITYPQIPLGRSKMIVAGYIFRDGLSHKVETNQCCAVAAGRDVKVHGNAHVDRDENGQGRTENAKSAVERPIPGRLAGIDRLKQSHADWEAETE